MFWNREVGSQIVSTPLITDTLADGKKEIVVPTFTEYLEVLDGKTGNPAQGFPYLFGELNSHASTLLYDIDGDGKNEIVYFTKNAEILFFKNGQPIYSETVKIPPLQVQKNWNSGISDGGDVIMSLEKPNTRTNAPTKSPGSRKLLNLGVNPVPVQIGADGWFSEEARLSLNLISYSPDATGIEKQSPLYSHSYNETVVEKGKIAIDSHILSTPIIIDLDNDGHDELIIAVSYYFDKEHYQDAANLRKLDVDVDISKYVAGGIVVIDLVTKQIKWTTHLDLTTDSQDQKAYIYSSPSVADIDADGSLEVLIGTGLGFIFCMDKHGNEKKGNFPIEMGEIRGQILTEDINGDGNIEICAVDARSNLACFNNRGSEVFERQISGIIDKVPMLGDINGDGILELVVGTSTGHIWALRGDNGVVLPNYPIKTAGPIHSSPLLMSFETDPKKKGLMIIIPSDDGFLYLINGATNCIDRIGIGEKTVSQVLADDITGTGKIDLIVSTLNGGVFLLGTNIPYHPMKAITNQISTLNGFASREHYHGIYTSLRSRKYRDVVGDIFVIEFVIVDNRKMPDHIKRKYDVEISVGRRHTLLKKTYKKPGFYVERLKSPSERMYGTINVKMRNEHHQVYLDSFAVSFNMTFLRTLKWSIVIPVLLTFAYLAMVMKPSVVASDLPQ